MILIAKKRHTYASKIILVRIVHVVWTILMVMQLLIDAKGSNVKMTSNAFLTIVEKIIIYAQLVIDNNSLMFTSKDTG